MKETKMSIQEPNRLLVNDSFVVLGGRLLCFYSTIRKMLRLIIRCDQNKRQAQKFIGFQIEQNGIMKQKCVKPTKTELVKNIL